MPVIKCFNTKCHNHDFSETDHCSAPLVEISKCEDATIRKEGKSTSFYLEQFKSNECHCGQAKRPRYSFCYTCFKMLPQDLQVDLYSRFGQGYEEAYEAAVKYLEENA